ncbi:hypothetical protein AB833_15155 [Chromatiales bacterium (ex Bugula neritina AB1)]|nr:hypothetical protein AB833_15155 [Chromatiales bacterium (ex Bugula neritina AB1)]
MSGFEELATEVSAESPSGRPDIEYDPVFQQLRIAIEGKAGSQMGAAVIEPQPPDFALALEICSDLLKQSKHMALLVFLVRAAFGAKGFRGGADALSVVHKIFCDQWDTIHPQAETDDPDDPWWERVGALRELTDAPDISETIYRANLVDVRHIGAFSLRDIDIANGKRSASEEEKERCNIKLIKGAFAESNAESIAGTALALQASSDTLREIAAFSADYKGFDALSFDSLIGRLEDCRAALKEYAAEKLTTQVVEADSIAGEHESAKAQSSDSTDKVAAEQVVAIPAAVIASSGRFTDRDSVAAAFDNIVTYYLKFEPSSPVPILVYRARQMVYKNFFDILQELAPNHKDNFRAILSALKDDPVSFLLEHSYSSFLGGETITASASLSGDGDEVTQNNDQSLSIESREQVLQTLADIQKFFETHEPSSPVPLIVDKVRNLVRKNFMDLLTEFESALTLSANVDEAG